MTWTQNSEGVYYSGEYRILANLPHGFNLFRESSFIGWHYTVGLAKIEAAQHKGRTAEQDGPRLAPTAPDAF